MLLVENKKGHVPELYNGKKYAMPCAASRGTAIPPTKVARVNFYHGCRNAALFFYNNQDERKISTLPIL